MTRFNTAIVLSAFLACAPAQAQPEVASVPGTPLRQTARLDFRIVIPPVLRLDARRQPDVLVVTEEDLLAGYVDLGECLQLEVTNNTPVSYGVQVGIGGSVVREARLSGSGEIRAGGGVAGLQLVRPARGSLVSTLTYRVRFELAPGARAGRYPWPLGVSLVRV